jgi:hypothetical protein
MTIHTCKYCNYSTQRTTLYNKHLLTIKHKKNIPKKVVNNKEGFDNKDILIDKIDSLAKQNKYLQEKIELLEKSNQELKETNNINTNKIVKEARSIKKSILTILNTNFKDTPSIDYIDESMFKKELELEYNCKIDDKDNKLFMRIFNDYERKKLIQTLSNLILKFIKKEDQKHQSVFNIDSARGNYATKIEDYWLNDKSGVQLKKYTLDMVIKFLLNVLDIFRQRLEVLIKQKNKTEFERDYVMKYQDLYLEIRSYLSNVNTHKKVMLFMCPELRLDQKILDTITD